MKISDAIMFQGTSGINIWGWNVSFSGVSSCGCVNNGAWSYELTRLNLLGIPTLPIDGACVDWSTNGAALWLPDSFYSADRMPNCGNPGIYLLNDPWPGTPGMTNDAICEILIYAWTNCAGLWPNLGSAIYGISPPDTRIETGWVGTNRVTAVSISAYYDMGVTSGRCKIFFGSAVTNCIFNQSPPDFTIPNQLTCGQTDGAGVTFYPGVFPWPTWSDIGTDIAVASGGSVTITPMTVGGRVAWSCGGNSGAPNLVAAYQVCPGNTNTIQAVPCLGQCIGTATAHATMAAHFELPGPAAGDGAFDASARATVGLAGHASHGVIGLAKAVLGLGGSTQKMVEDRGAICDACPHAKRTAGLFDGCSKCGCVIWAKIRNADEHCPVGKW